MENYDKADLLARNLIDVDPVNFSKSLAVPKLVRKEFEKYLGRDEFGNLIPVVLSDEYVSSKALEFVHSSRKIPFGSAYMGKRYRGDFSQKSFYDSCRRILNKENFIGDCVGLSSVVKYLLDSMGVDNVAFSYFMNNDKNEEVGHLGLKIVKDDELVSLESTRPSGYDYEIVADNFYDSDLVSVVASSIGLSLFDRGDYCGAVGLTSKAFSLDPKNENVRACFKRASSFYLSELCGE